MIIKLYLLSIARGAFALATGSGELTTGTLLLMLGKTKFPPDLAGVRHNVASAGILRGPRPWRDLVGREHQFFCRRAQLAPVAGGLK